MYLMIALFVGGAYGFVAWVIHVVPNHIDPDRGITPNQLRLVMAIPNVVVLIVTWTAFDWPVMLGAGVVTYLVTLLTMRARTRAAVNDHRGNDK
jgi:hypothetical protein